MPFHIDGAERTCGTQVLAGAATDTAFGVDGRYLRGTGHRRVGRHHRDGAGRAMARAVAASHAVGQRHAVLSHPYGMADLNGRLFGRRYFLNRARGTYLRTLRAFGAAITAFVRRFGLHERFQVGRGPQHVVRANRHAELTSRAMLREMAQAARARRHDGRLTTADAVWPRWRPNRRPPVFPAPSGRTWRPIRRPPPKSSGAPSPPAALALWAPRPRPVERI